MFAILALSQRLGNYENKPLALILAIGASGSLLWFSLQFVSEALGRLREAKKHGDLLGQRKVYAGFACAVAFAAAVVMALVWSPIPKTSPPPIPITTPPVTQQLDPAKTAVPTYENKEPAKRDDRKKLDLPLAEVATIPRANKVTTQLPAVSAPYGIAIGGGTVTSPTVNNYGPVERHLTASQIQALSATAEVLPDSMSEWLVIETTTDSNASIYAREILTIFSAHRKVKTFLTRLIEPNPELKGIYVLIHSGEDDNFKAAQQIANAMQRSGMAVTFQAADYLAPKQIKIVVLR